jgi:hypothetical protein
MTNWSRRSLLDALTAGGAVGVAGCGANDSESDPKDATSPPGDTTTAPPTDPPTVTPTTTVEPTASVTRTASSTATTAAPDRGDAPTTTEASRRLVAAGVDTYDYFGATVATDSDGSTVVVGSPNDEDPNGRSGGSAYVLDRGDGSWSEGPKLVPTDGSPSDEFGRSVAVSADGMTAVVGAPFDEGPDGARAGAAYVFSRSDSGWTQRTTLTATDRGSDDVFGSAVAVSDDGRRALVGAPLGDGPGGRSRGTAAVFERSAGGWERETSFAPPDDAGIDSFGGAVALSADGSTALVGVDAPLEPRDDPGAAFAFARSDGEWGSATTLRATDGTAGDSLGFSVALSADGETALVGARDAATDGGDRAGEAYLFGAGAGGWDQRARLTAPDGDDDDRLGRAVALSANGTVAVVGAPFDEDPAGFEGGSAYRFDRSGDGWGLRDKLVAADGGTEQRFGAAVALSGNDSTPAVGVPRREGEDGPLVGAVSLFE